MRHDLDCWSFVPAVIYSPAGSISMNLLLRPFVAILGIILGKALRNQWFLHFMLIC